jgi:hypothetical protein
MFDRLDPNIGQKCKALAWQLRKARDSEKNHQKILRSSLDLACYVTLQQIAGFNGFTLAKERFTFCLTTLFTPINNDNDSHC